MITQASAFILIVAFWIVGGQGEKWGVSGRFRDVPVPILIGIGCAITLKVWWIFLALSATYQIIRLGYGNYDPENDDKPSHLASLLHDRDGWWIRAVWGLLVASIGASALLMWHYIGVWVYVGYILLNIVVNFCVSRFRLGVFLTDTLVSLAIGCIVFLVR